MDGSVEPGAPPDGSRVAGALLSARGAIAVVVGLGLAGYSNTFSVPFHWDDGRSIVQNPAVRDLGSFLASGAPASRWVAYLTFAANGSLGGLTPWGYHALNLAIHLAAAFAVYSLAAFVCRAAAPPGSPLDRNASRAALLAAALFVAHPLQTQAVTYIVQRMASLAALLYLAAVLAYARAALEGRAHVRAALYVAALAAGALAMFTKDNAVTLPAALGVLELCFLSGSPGRRAARLAPFAALTAIALLALDPSASLVQTNREFARARAGDALAGAGAVVRAPAWASYAATQPSVILSYLRLVVFPAGQNLDHDHPVASSFLDPQAILAAAALGVLLLVPAGIAWRARRRSAGARVVLFAIGWFVATMAVESSVLPISDVMMEHRMYLPSAGLFVAVGAALASAVARLARRGRTVTFVATAGAVLALAGTTYARNEVWRDRETLWRDAMEKSPAKSRPPVFVAQELLARGEEEQAIALLERATGLRPREPLVDVNLALAYEKAGRRADAERTLRTAIALGAASVKGVHYELGRVLLADGRIPEACAQFEAEVRAHPANRVARTNLVVCSLSRGDATAAVAQAEQLDAESPGDPTVLFNLALAASSLGDVPRAADAYRRFLASAGPTLESQRARAARWLVEHGAGPP
jgi:Flp pilus assembly protein TadD